jgi:hypothetical protein
VSQPNPDCQIRAPHTRHTLTGGKPTNDKTCEGFTSIESEGCCTSCDGLGVGGPASGPETNGRCADCRGLGCCHDGPCNTSLGAAVLGEVPECNGVCHTQGDYPDFDKDCPVHGGEREICPEGCGVQLVDEVHDEQIGFEERARPVIVTRLACEHEIVVETTWRHVENVWTGGLL